MSSPLRIIEAGKPERMKFASFGRERDIEMIESWTKDPAERDRRILQTAAAHDLNDGIGSVEAFINATRDAVFPATLAARDAPLVLMARIAWYYPECLEIWVELADSARWQDRFTTACRLYSRIPEGLSDRLFDKLRNDKSSRVSGIARDRYRNRPDKRGYIVFDGFDPDQFDDRVRRGEVVL